MITVDHLVRRITVCILPTCLHLRSANFGLRFASRIYNTDEMLRKNGKEVRIGQNFLVVVEGF